MRGEGIKPLPTPLDNPTPISNGTITPSATSTANGPSDGRISSQRAGGGTDVEHDDHERTAAPERDADAAPEPGPARRSCTSRWGNHEQTDRRFAAGQARQPLARQHLAR